MDVEKLGQPIAFVALDDGTPVYDRAGERIGVAERVMVEEDIFEGVVIHTHPLPGRHLFADVEQIAELRERGLVLAVDRGELHALGEMKPKQTGTPLEARVRRAWDWLSRRG